MLLLAALLQESRPYPAFVWRHGGPPADAAWSKAIRDLGFTGTNVEGTEAPDRATSIGLELYADHLVKRDVFRRDAEDPAWAAMVDAYERTRSSDGLRRVPSLDDPASVEEFLRAVPSLAERAARAGARFLSVADEPSFTVDARPLDLDHGDAALAAFRRRLPLLYSSPEALARAWRTPRAPFADVEPWTTDEIRAR
ncbi:MAG TPA: hypothetical protein VKE69_05785, partial [Planctomycetota bacterium]|nr:hypothetical protein [Planctomycetota bacterium]